MTSAFWCQNILRHFTWSALPLLYFWSDSPIGCSAPLYSRSGSLIGSAYYFLYISFCFRFNKSLTNLTLLRQHHLQYISKQASHFCGQDSPFFLLLCPQHILRTVVNAIKIHLDLWIQCQIAVDLEILWYVARPNKGTYYSRYSKC